MGIIDLEAMNKAPLGKWLWNLEKTEGLWQQLLRDKYLSRKILTAQKTKTGASHFWQGLMEIKDTFFIHCLEKKKQEMGPTSCFGKTTGWGDLWHNNSLTYTEIHTRFMTLA